VKFIDPSLPTMDSMLGKLSKAGAAQAHGQKPAPEGQGGMHKEAGTEAMSGQAAVQCKL